MTFICYFWDFANLSLNPNLNLNLSLATFKCFFSKYQSGFRKSKSTSDHLFRLSQTIMESEHVVAAFLDVEKA